MNIRDDINISQDIVVECTCPFPKEYKVGKVCADCYWVSQTRKTWDDDAIFDSVCRVNNTVILTRAYYSACDSFCSEESGKNHEKHMKLCMIKHTLSNLEKISEAMDSAEDSDRTSW